MQKCLLVVSERRVGTNEVLLISVFEKVDCISFWAAAGVPLSDKQRFCCLFKGLPEHNEGNTGTKTNKKSGGPQWVISLISLFDN